MNGKYVYFATDRAQLAKYELGQVGAMVEDGHAKWGKRTDPMFVLTPDRVANAPVPDLTLKGTFSEGEAEFVLAMCEVLLAAEALAWEPVQASLDAAQAKHDKKNKKK